jgi:hypothetical protein
MNLSICILYHQGDISHIPECLKNLPEGAEILLCETIKSDKNELEYLHSNRYIYRYTELHLGMIRNALKAKATKEWILTIDPDERLLNFQHNLLKEMLDNCTPQIGGMDVQILGYSSKVVGMDGQPVHYNVQSTRIFRNNPDFNYISPIHETINLSIEQKGYLVVDTPIIIYHLGYDISPIEYRNKLERNVKGLIKSGMPNQYEHYFNTMLRDAALLWELTNKLEGVK